MLRLVTTILADAVVGRYPLFEPIVMVYGTIPGACTAGTGTRIVARPLAFVVPRIGDAGMPHVKVIAAPGAGSPFGKVTRMGTAAWVPGEAFALNATAVTWLTLVNVLLPVAGPCVVSPLKLTDNGLEPRDPALTVQFTLAIPFVSVVALPITTPPTEKPRDLPGEATPALKSVAEIGILAPTCPWAAFAAMVDAGITTKLVPVPLAI